MANNGFRLSEDLEQELINLDGSVERPYIENSSRIAEEIKETLPVGESYTLFTRYSVTPIIRKNLKDLKRALHTSFGDNGVKYHVLLEDIDDSNVSLTIKRTAK
jgi:hypothetical protein